MLYDTLMLLADVSAWIGPTGFACRIVQHVGITAVVLLIGVVLAVPIGIVCGHTGVGSGIVGALVGMSRAVPSIGLLILFGLAFGIGPLAPTLALIVLVVPSLFAGGYAGIASVDGATVDAARAMGFSDWQIVTRVEIPLGARTILGSVRQAALQASASATLVAYTADLGLGRFIFAGLKSRDYPLIIAASVIVIAITLAIDLVFEAMQNHVGWQPDLGEASCGR